MDRDFLFATLAVQIGFTTPQQVMAAASAFLADKSRPIADRLVSDGILDQTKLEMLTRMVDEALKVHGGDVRKTVDTLGGERALYASFGGSLVVDEAGEVSIAPEVEREDDSIEDTSAVTPETSGRYRLGEGAEIGRGGIGRVLVAFDEHLGREIAVKELLAEVSGSAVSTPKTDRISRTGAIAARFLREARVTGQLEHPNIVPVYEVGQREDGAYYYTMKLVRGRTLADALKACHALPDRLKLLHHYVDLCNAIAYAHSRGVIHRDIKTDNVMLGEFGETVVLDWGLAKVKGKQDIRGGEIARELKMLHDAGTGQTVDGSAIGTPAYMSPEQADGQVEEIDERSDIWSLGAVLYEVLTGKPPFEGFTPYEIIGKVLKDDVVSPRARSEEIPAELSAVATKALTRDKPKRYQQAGDLADEINAYMSGGRIAAYEYSSFELLKGFIAKNRAASALIGLVVVLLIVGGGILYGAYQQAGEERDRAESEKTRAEEERARAQANEQQSELNLSAAFQEKAERLFDERSVLFSRVYSAAALAHHPCGTASDLSAKDCDARFPGGSMLRVRAISNVYQTNLNVMARPVWGHQHDKELHLLDASADGRLLASLDHDARISLWDVESRKLLASLSGSAAMRTYCLAVSPDGQTIAGCRGEQTVVLWDRSGRELGTLEHPGDKVHRIDVSPRDDLLAVSTADSGVVLWNLETRVRVRALQGGGAIEFSPDGSRIAVGGADVVLLYDVVSGRLLHEVRGIKGAVNFAISPDGRLLAAASVYRVVELVDLETGAHLRTLSGHDEGVQGVAFSPDGKLLVSGSGDKTLWFWDTRTFEKLYVLEGHTSALEDVLFLQDGKTLASAGEDGAMRVWSLSREELVPTLPGHTARTWRCRFSPDGRVLASSGDDGMVRIWDPATVSQLRILEVPHGNISDVSFSSDGSIVAAPQYRSDDLRKPGVHLWEVATGKKVATIDTGEDRVYSIALSPDAKTFVGHTIYGVTKLWDVESGRVTRGLESDGEGQSYVEFSPDGRLIVTGGADRSVRLYDAVTGELRTSLIGHSDVLYNFSFSADGTRLLSSGKQGSILLWDVATGRKLREFVGHARWVNDVKFVPGGEFIVSASDDGTVRLWRIDSGEVVLIIKTPTGGNDVEVHPDGEHIAVLEMGPIRLYPIDLSLYDADPEQLLTEAEKAAGMKLDGFSLVPLEQ
ncbi:MAG: serine/threonine protein kinase [Deltaproteobacteria bacterium]|nr:serine/threonine protein kinase [Deltaproteobacteria bacterium]